MSQLRHHQTAVAGPPPAGTTIEVPLGSPGRPTGRALVTGRAVGPLLVHYSLDLAGGYDITHIATGCKLPGTFADTLAGKDAAMAAARELQRFDWAAIRGRRQGARVPWKAEAVAIIERWRAL